MTVGVWVLGDQLWTGQSALQSCAGEPANTPVILIESLSHGQAMPYHLQKLVLVWSAMRHFAEELRQANWQVSYYPAAETFQAPLTEWVTQQGITELRVMAPSDRPFAQLIQALDLPCQVRLLPNNCFLWSREDFRAWAVSHKRLLMEDFYRESRRRFQVLMDGNQPLGGRWNFDQENRKPPKGGLKTPQALWFEPDAITQDIIDWIKRSDRFQRHRQYWQIEPFRWAVTRQQALQVLDFFIHTRLPGFGPYQDAMVTGEMTLWHSMISPYLNLSLLHPLEVVQAAGQAYLENQNDWNLSSVEGFIRQVMGWREYMHGVYHLTDEDYPQRNWFDHTHSLPEFFWTGETDMNCLYQILTQVKQTGYAHHIQRLMVLSNFALIAGLSPQAIESWFHAAFIDAYDWVMQTNVIGMGLFADGGVLASKPYAASANYINRMSDYCHQCRYSARDRTGDNACPFNFFYWDFLDRHREKLSSQGRMGFILKNLDKISPAERQAMGQQAAEWHSRALGVEG
ncbi:cryptochrome/photolyase family protein [Leptothermofonsia sichuanensis E412]|uniref:cryptochrome/photolyase family protein n=1 Tax=Leptothermofonsia sichuanensis TaxID=2917832 RepID=UPI001CA7A2BF|nr:cryptochrome/photolyase family protein [Leptothermofonsia sichuanensis]QZZ22037.1 cryptochrome/photolyase family protein [Leptothermofonsia sichuanensis E412]